MTGLLWRRDPDSSHRAEPRTFIRVFVEPGRLAPAVEFYERLLGVECDMRMPYPQRRLRLAAVGGFLLIDGDAEATHPFRPITGTLLADAIDGYPDRLTTADAQILRPPIQVPAGAGFTARHPASCAGHSQPSRAARKASTSSLWTTWPVPGTTRTSKPSPRSSPAFRSSIIVSVSAASTRDGTVGGAGR